mgnify:CR=1 FL=1
MRIAAQAARGEDRAHLHNCGVEDFIDDHVIELVVMRHFLARGGEPARDRVLAVLPALAHPLFQRFPRRRQDEDADRVRHLLADLARPLPVDFQQYIAARSQLRFHRLPRGALEVAMHERVFEEIACIDHALEFAGADEMVVLGMAFARARRARGERDRQRDVRIARQTGVDDAGLARARGCGDDEKVSAHGG